MHHFLEGIAVWHCTINYQSFNKNMTIAKPIVIEQFCCLYWHLNAAFDIANTFFSIHIQDSTINMLASRKAYTLRELKYLCGRMSNVYHRQVEQTFTHRELLVGIQIFNYIHNISVLVTSTRKCKKGQKKKKKKLLALHFMPSKYCLF